MGNNVQVRAFGVSPSKSNSEISQTVELAKLPPFATQRDWTVSRRWKRYCVDMPVQVRVTTQGPTRIISSEGQGSDISGGGLAVSVEVDLPVGSQIAVEFTPPSTDEPVVFRCFVRNREGYRYGLEFITENDDDYQKAGELQAGLAAMDCAPQG